jgi:indolepyruvate ferredoxin oxidoreductase
MLPKLSPATHGAICEWAEAAAGIKGFGHVKARNLQAARARMADIAKGVSA